MASGRPPALQPTGQGQTDRKFLILVGTIAGVALAGIGAARLGRRRATAARATTTASTFVFPPALDVFPTRTDEPVRNLEAVPTPRLFDSEAVRVESAGTARRAEREPIVLDHRNTV